MSGMKVSQAKKVARGYRSRILLALGVNVLKNRHQPCPVCARRGRFRFDDQEGQGTWFCNQCEVGDGLALISGALDVGISEVTDRIDDITGNLPPVSQGMPKSGSLEGEVVKQAAAVLTTRLFEKSRQTTGNVHLAGKGFYALSYRELTAVHKVGSVAFRAGDLTAPLYANGELANLQLINADGGKYFLRGGQVKNTFCLVVSAARSAKRLWMAEGYATALATNHLTGDAVMVAFSSANFLSLANVACSQYPTHQIIIATDHDLNGAGQVRGETTARTCGCIIVLPPVFSDQNDTFTQNGEEVTRQTIYEVIKLAVASPLDTMNKAELTALSVSEEAQRVVDHYKDALAVDLNEQLLLCYEAGAWKVISCADSARDVTALFQRLGTPSSSGETASLVETLKLIAPQQRNPARQLIGFRNGMLDARTGLFSLHDRKY